MEVDPAGMGTEIGLEVSLGPVGNDLDTDAATAEAATPDDDTPMGWLARRLRRDR